MSEADINQLIAGALSSNPVDVKTAFEAAIGGKVLAAIEDKKVEIASDLFGDTSEDDTPDEDFDFEELDLDDDFNIDAIDDVVDED